MQQPRRWYPVLSIGLAVVWLLVTLGVQLGYGSERRALARDLDAAVRLALHNPMVVVPPRLLPPIRAVMPGFETNEIFSFLRRAPQASDGPSPQERLDALAERAFARLDAQPVRRLGLVPADPAPQALLGHLLLHSGWLHLLATLAIWLLVAPTVERLWGRRLLAVGGLGIAAIGAGAFWLAHPGLDRALVGPSALVAGLVAAAALRLRDRPIDWLAASGGRAELRAPAWGLVGVWLVYEASLQVLVPGTLAPGVDNAVGVTAHAASALAGVGIAALFAKLGLEQRFGGSLEAFGEAVAAPGRFDFQRVLAARARGDADRAFEMLRVEVARSARNRDAVTTFWEMCIERGDPSEATPAMLRLVREELRRGAEEVAVAHWRELSQHLPDGGVEAATLLRLIPSIRRVDGDPAAQRALRGMLGTGGETLPPAVAAQAAIVAADLEPELARKAATRALTSGKLTPGTASEISDLVKRLQVGGVEFADEEPDVPQIEEKDVAPSVFYLESDRSAFGDVSDLSDLDEEFPRGSVTEGKPRSLDAEALRIEVGAETQLIGYDRLRAVAAAGVAGLSEKPVVLIDLVVDGGGTELPLRVIRFRSDRYDARRLAPDAGGFLAALARFVATLLERSRARPLPDAEAARLKPVRMFESLEAYQSEVLQPLAREWA